MLFISIETASFLDNLSANENEKAMYSLIAITAITLVSQAMYYVVQIIYLKVSNKIALNIKKDLAHRVLSISSATLDHTASGTIINRIDNDPEHLIGSLDQIAWVLSDFIGCMLTVVYIAVLNWIVGLAVLGVILILLTIEVVRSKVYLKNTKKEQKFSTK